MRHLGRRSAAHLLTAGLAALSLVPFAGAAQATPSSAELVTLPAQVRSDLSPAEQRVVVQALAPAAQAGEDVAVLHEVDGQLEASTVHAEPGRAEELSAVLAAQPSVLAADVDHRRSITVASAALPRFDDPGRDDQWALDRLRAEETRAAYRGSGRVWAQLPVIAVVDTGVQSSHPDLANRTVAGYDFVADAARAAGKSIDGNGHGTHVAGIIGANAGNKMGVAGLVGEARIMPIRVLDNSGGGYDSDVALGIVWAVDHGAKVINLSLGGPETSDLLVYAANYAHDHGALLVAAAGNDGDLANELSYPCAYTSVLCVAATTATDQHADFSTYNTAVDVAAPGEAIVATYNGSSYAEMSGTSMATPYAAATAALVRAAYPRDTVDAVRARMTSTATDLGTPGTDVYFGAGLINPYRLVADAPLDAPVHPTSLRLELSGGTKAVVRYTGSLATPGRAAVTGYRIAVDETPVTVSAATRELSIARPAAGATHVITVTPLSAVGPGTAATLTIAAADVLRPTLAARTPATVKRGAVTKVGVAVAGKALSSGKVSALVGVPLAVYAGKSTAALARVGTVTTDASGNATYAKVLAGSTLIQFRYLGRGYAAAPSRALPIEAANSAVVTARVQ